MTSEPLADRVPVGPGGEVRAWAWIPDPLPGQPLARPFAWALVRLDADTALLHAVDAGDEGRMRTGLRVAYGGGSQFFAMWLVSRERP